MGIESFACMPEYKLLSKVHQVHKQGVNRFDNQNCWTGTRPVILPGRKRLVAMEEQILLLIDNLPEPLCFNLDSSP